MDLIILFGKVIIVKKYIMEKLLFIKSFKKLVFSLAMLSIIAIFAILIIHLW